MEGAEEGEEVEVERQVKYNHPGIKDLCRRKIEKEGLAKSRRFRDRNWPCQG